MSDVAFRQERYETYADIVDIGSDDVGKGSSITKVGVDTSETLAIGGADVVEDDMSLVADLAVTTRAVELAEGFDGEAAD